MKITRASVTALSLSTMLAFGAAQNQSVNVFAQNNSSYAIDIEFNDNRSVLLHPHDSLKYVGTLNEGGSLTYTYRGWSPKTFLWDYLRAAANADVLITFNEYTGPTVSGGYFPITLNPDQKRDLLNRLDALSGLSIDAAENRIDADTLRYNFTELLTDMPVDSTFKVPVDQQLVLFAQGNEKEKGNAIRVLQALLREWGRRVREQR